MPELVHPQCGSLIDNGDPMEVTRDAVERFASAISILFRKEFPESCSKRILTEFDYRVSMSGAATLLMDSKSKEMN